MTFDGQASRVAEAHQFTVEALGDAPGVDLVELVTSELATNAIQHSESGLPGGRFTLHLAEFADRWQIRIDDAGSKFEPEIPPGVKAWNESGRGLAVVASLSARWG